MAVEKAFKYPFNSIRWLQYKPLLNVLRHGILQSGNGRGGHNAALFLVDDVGEAAM